jgi:hypothetical protein
VLLLSDAFKSVGSAYAHSIFISYNYKTFYGLESCSHPFAHCGNKSAAFRALIRNHSLIRDLFQHEYTFNNGETYSIIVKQSTTNYLFDPTDQPWYDNINNTWSDAYLFQPDAGQARTYITRVGDIRIGAVRINNEPCPGCLSNSSAIALVNQTKLDNTIIQGFGKTIMVDAEAIIKQLLSFVSQTD